MTQKCWLTATLCSLLAVNAAADEWIRVNQMGYLPQSKKVAVFLSEEDTQLQTYTVIDVFSGKEVKRFASPKATGTSGQMKSTYRLDFSDVKEPGTYYIKAGDAQSPTFVINPKVWNGTADFILNYMRQQRCGYNPYLKDSCHVHDGYIVGHPTRSGQKIDVRGGWHDATDYLQYTTTTANALYQMMFAYQMHPEVYADAYNAHGQAGANGIPDIVDEIKWGIDFLCRLNPEDGELYNQVADDRDHAGMRLPNHDKVDYGYGPGTGRPVYYCSGKPQQRGTFLNATTGIASTAGKFASTFALGSEILKPFYPTLAAEIGRKAKIAFEQGVNSPGVCQTASVKSPYIYEEDNWVDDMELAAAQLYQQQKDRNLLHKAVEYGRQEPITPWMGADSARHYQWYPFLNLGHYQLAKQSEDSRVRKEFTRNLRSGIERVYEKAMESPFLYGIPSIWCSNNLTVAMVTQCQLYRELTGDTRYEEMEAALRDWLFGCNPWGTSMVVELPLYGDYPTQPHSSLLFEKAGNTTGGLVDGPVYSNIFNNLRGVRLEGGEAYERFQPATMVYHDCLHDYSTNEPTMDGTASLSFLLASMQAEGNKQIGKPATPDRNVYSHGGIIRTDPSKKQISLVFTAADKADGEKAIRRILKKLNIQGAFFFTGDFYRLYPQTVKALKAEGHYVGAHSFGHPLYCSWEKRDSTLITREDFTTDLLTNYGQMQEAGISPQEAPYFIPPYEHYNAEIAAWSKSLGVQLINFTAGTLSNADYTTPDMKSYRSSKVIYNKILEVERQEGLNGHLMLFHFGTSDLRTDKYYDHYLEKTIKELRRRGYSFQPLTKCIE